MVVTRRVGPFDLCITLFLLFGLTTTAAAQQAPSGIAGVVKDASGGVLPGVTVEAASPVLIERVRSVTTDTDGRYNVIDLRPGTYTVTFSLPGFNTYRREGIAISVGFTATVNADLAVGSLAETITVTGETPLVDTQNARQQKVLTDDVLQALPTGQTNIVNVIALTPGFTGNATVGGSTGAYHGQQTKGTYHGKRGTHLNFDGMRIDNYAGAGDSPGYLFNTLTIEETALETGGATAESSSPNVAMNMVPKEGANTFRFSIEGLFTNHNFQSSNLTAALRERTITDVPKLNRMYDAGFTVGGPIKQDKVWFFAAIRRWGVRNQAAGLYWNQTQGTPVYTPDPSRPAFRDEKYQSHAVRVTWQVSQRNKLNIFTDIKKDCICASGGAGSALGAGANNALEGEAPWRLWPNGLIQATWTSPLTSKLLLEAGVSDVMFHWPNLLMPGTSPEDVAITEQSTNFRYNNVGGLYQPRIRLGDRYSERFSLSYVTGSHTFKSGVQWDQGFSDTENIGLGRQGAKGVSYQFNRGVPVALRYDAIFREVYYQKAELGIYAQDQWTKKRLSVNYGLRFDYYNGYVPPVHETAHDFTPEVNYPSVHGGPAWKDINPRVGAAYDLFGNGRTAFKLSIGRYVAMTGNGQVRQYNPLNSSVNNTTRSWNDTNGNFLPDCDLRNFANNGECGPIANSLFGQANPNATRFAQDVRHGWGIRPYTWDLGTEIQHQLNGSMSMTAGYYHNWDGAFIATDNTSVTAADFDPFCITAPSDPRLPKGGGYQVCGLADVTPARFGAVTNLVTQTSNFGKQTRTNDFFGVSFETRLGRGMRVGGGIDSGRTVDDVCFNVDSPAAVAASLPGASTLPVPHTATTIDGKKTCRVVTPLAGNTQAKLNGSIPLPADAMISATYQNLPGLSYLATYNATTAEIAPSLGRNLAGGTRTLAVPLVMPQTLRENRRSQLDLRLTKYLTMGKRRVQANFDLYNLFNSGDILGENITFGSSWRKPTLILNGRLIQFSANMTF
jgi:hypothetical protein